VRALQILHRLQAELNAEQALRPGARWLTSIAHAQQLNEALMLLADDLGEEYVTGQLYRTTRKGGHLVIGSVLRDQLLTNVQDVLQRLDATYA
jgi:hypothetical protein